MEWSQNELRPGKNAPRTPRPSRPSQDLPRCRTWADNLKHCGATGLARAFAEISQRALEANRVAARIWLWCSDLVPESIPIMSITPSSLLHRLIYHVPTLPA